MRSDISTSRIFQSTLPRKERRPPDIILAFLVQISIHAPTKGATKLQVLSYKFVIISIHAPTKGATLLHRYLWQMECNFNPRSHERSDWIICNEIISILEFQSTLPRKERLGNVSFLGRYPNFNPRSHERSDPQL